MQTVPRIESLTPAAHERRRSFNIRGRVRAKHRFSRRHGQACSRSRAASSITEPCEVRALRRKAI